MNDVKTAIPFSEEDGEHYEPFKVFHLSVLVGGFWLLALDLTKVDHNFSFDFFLFFGLSNNYRTRVYQSLSEKRHFLLTIFGSIAILHLVVWILFLDEHYDEMRDEAVAPEIEINELQVQLFTSMFINITHDLKV